MRDWGNLAAAIYWDLTFGIVKASSSSGGGGSSCASKKDSLIFAFVLPAHVSFLVVTSAGSHQHIHHTHT